MAPGLATFINCSDESLRLIISPLLRTEDKEAIENSIVSTEDFITSALEDFVVTENTIAQHTLKCLSWLLRHGRVEIKIALMNDALFHPKVWLFREGDDVIAAHGSSNMTYAGIQKNIEQISISKSWEDYTQSVLYNRETFVNNSENFGQICDESCTVVSMPQAIKENLLKDLSFRYSHQLKTDLQDALQSNRTDSIEESSGDLWL